RQVEPFEIDGLRFHVEVVAVAALAVAPDVVGGGAVGGELGGEAERARAQEHVGARAAGGARGDDGLPFDLGELLLGGVRRNTRSNAAAETAERELESCGHGILLVVRTR